MENARFSPRTGQIGMIGASKFGAITRMEITQPENIKVLSHLKVDEKLNYMARKRPDAPAFALWSSVPDAYRECGCHPEIVERLWDQIGAALPGDCRGLVYGNPALTHPESGVILAVGLGTWYGLRLPGSLLAEAIKAGAKTQTKWSDGNSMDIQLDFGEDWVFGAWLPNELTWCKSVYETFNHA
jgi:hypothetical protein